MKCIRIARRTAAASLLLCLWASNGSALSWGVRELETEQGAIAFAREVQRGGYRVLSTGELKARLDAKDPMRVVDTMPFADSYRKRHIPGAVNFELPVKEMETMEPAVQAAFEKLLGPDKARTLVFYCGFTKCTRSHNGAMWAVKLGYRNVYRQPGGIRAWEQAGYPVENAE
jgi:rhodanese-related sulfurtransferase